MRPAAKLLDGDVGIGEIERQSFQSDEQWRVATLRQDGKHRPAARQEAVSASDIGRLVGGRRNPNCAQHEQGKNTNNPPIARRR